ncbi:MAG: hypothetical protein ACJA2W_002372 [Planctomycetota bacterium]|jgi:hypothetical protein
MMSIFLGRATGFMALTFLGLLGGTSCQTNGVPVNEAFFVAQPRSILVLPPLDETIETAATYGTLASVTVPLVEAGYYVFPVAVVDAMMRENGLPTPYEMHAVPLSKLREIFQPDAVLYLRVTDWGTSYQVINSSTRIGISGELLDARSGEVLWSGQTLQVQNSNSGGGGIVGMLAGAIVSQVATSISDPSRSIARSANWDLLQGRNRGWILGPYHPNVEEDREQVKAMYQAE